MSVSKKYLFIINPKAGTHQYPALSQLLEERAIYHKQQAEIVITNYAGHAYDLVCGIDLHEYAVIVAVGGDGTINEIARALVQQPVDLAIIPTGSGNGLARFYKIPLTLKDAVDTVFTGKRIKMDVVKLNQHYSFNVSGVGFDAAVAHEFQYLKKRGLWGYVKCIAKQLGSFEPITVKIKLSNFNKINMLENQFFLLAIANTNQFGNDAIIAPGASTVDGKLNLVGVKAFSWWQLPYYLWMLMRKQIDRAKNVVSEKLEHCEIHASTDKWHIDGEPMIMTSPVEIKTLPLSLNIIVPNYYKHEQEK